MCQGVPGFRRQIFKHVPKCKGIPLTNVSWIPRTNTCNVNLVSTFVFLRTPQQANVASCSGFRSYKSICGFHLHFEDSTYNLRIPLTVAESANLAIFGAISSGKML